MGSLSARLVAMIVGAVLLVALIAFGVTQCQQRKSAGKQAEVSREQGNASIGSGAEAVNTVGNVANSDAATDEAVASGVEAVRNAPEGEKGKAALKALCQMKTYRDTPGCKEPQP